MKKQLNLICSILAIFCFISMYMPVIAPRYPASDYFPAAGSSYSDEYYCTGDYYYAREYWDMTRFVFSDRSPVGRVLLSITQALLLLWALMSVRGEAGVLGLWAAGLNLAVTAFILVRMFAVAGFCQWGVLAVMAVDDAAAAALAIVAAGPERLAGGLRRLFKRR